jgi:hypothetical protein
MARAFAFESDGHAAVSHLGICISVLASRTSAILRTPLAPPVAAAAAVAAVQLTAAYHNRGRASLQFGWEDDAWEDFVIAGGIASASLPAVHRIKKAVQNTSRQAAAAAAAVAAAAAKAEEESGGSRSSNRGGTGSCTTDKKQSRKKGWSMLL